MNIKPLARYTTLIVSESPGAREDSTQSTTIPTARRLGGYLCHANAKARATRRKLFQFNSRSKYNSSTVSSHHILHPPGYSYTCLANKQASRMAHPHVMSSHRQDSAAHFKLSFSSQKTSFTPPPPLLLTIPPILTFGKVCLLHFQSFKLSSLHLFTRFYPHTLCPINDPRVSNPDDVGDVYQVK